MSLNSVLGPDKVVINGKIFILAAQWRHGGMSKKLELKVLGDPEKQEVLRRLVDPTKKFTVYFVSSNGVILRIDHAQTVLYHPQTDGQYSTIDLVFSAEEIYEADPMDLVKLRILTNR